MNLRVGFCGITAGIIQYNLRSYFSLKAALLESMSIEILTACTAGMFGCKLRDMPDLTIDYNPAVLDRVMSGNLLCREEFWLGHCDS